MSQLVFILAVIAVVVAILVPPSLLANFLDILAPVFQELRTFTFVTEILSMLGLETLMSYSKQTLSDALDIAEGPVRMVLASSMTQIRSTATNVPAALYDGLELLATILLEVPPSISAAKRCVCRVIPVITILWAQLYVALSPRTATILSLLICLVLVVIVLLAVKIIYNIIIIPIDFTQLIWHRIRGHPDHDMSPPASSQNNSNTKFRALYKCGLCSFDASELPVIERHVKLVHQRRR